MQRKKIQKQRSKKEFKKRTGVKGANMPTTMRGGFRI